MHKSCIKCGSKQVKKYGKTSSCRQRYKCLSCGSCYTWQKTLLKHKQAQIWFKYWVLEGLSKRQISNISPHSYSTIKRLCQYWLKQAPPTIPYDFARIKYLLFDGTYFKHEHCLLVFMDYPTGQVIGHRYTIRENYQTVYDLACELRQKGLTPISVTLDGHPSVIRALLTVWPHVKIQRCIYHIIHQGSMWLRTYPKTQAGKDLKALLQGLGNNDRESFERDYKQVIEQHGEFIKRLSSKTIGEKDVKKAMALITNAQGNMWHYEQDKNIAPTNNKLEGYFSELKQKYRAHKGLKKEHREAYLNWYIYYKNRSK